MTLPVILRFSTDDENWITLCEKYWEINNEQQFVHKVAELSRDFNISKNQIAKLVSQYSSAYSDRDCCSQCQSPYMFTSRSDFQQRIDRTWSWICAQCQRKDEELREAAARHKQQQYREIIREEYGSGNPGPIDSLALSLESAVYLLSFVRLLANEDFSFARSLESVKRRLSPTNNMDLEILKLLYHENLISVSPDSQIDAFQGERAQNFYLTKVCWHLPFGLGSENPKDFAGELEEILRSSEWPDDWLDDQLDLWKKVALHECLQYLAVALNEHGFSFTPGEKTFMVIRNLLEDYSVAQIWNFIWRAAKDAAAFYLREAVTKLHVANTVVGAIQRYGERAKAERWDIKPYRRHFDCPQSIFSEVLFNAVLRIGDDGFNKVPSIRKLAILQRPEVDLPSDGVPGSNNV
jgi:hypothetical protein